MATSPPYNLNVVILDLVPTISNTPGGIVQAVRAEVGFTYVTVGPAGGEQFQSSVALDVQRSDIASFNINIPVSPYPPPNPTWDAGMTVQEQRGIAAGTGWLFRSGIHSGTLPDGLLEIITADEQLIDNALARRSLPSLPFVSTDTAGNVTTVNSITVSIRGTGIDFTATGTDSRLPAGATFDFTGTLQLFANPSVRQPETPLGVRLVNPLISFTAGPGTGFATAVLNAVRGIILDTVAPQVERMLSATINTGLLAAIAAALSKGELSSLPPGVIASIRQIRGFSRALPDGSTEPVIGVLGAVGGFGGVANKFPSLVPGPGQRPCFIATAAAGADDADVIALRHWRDKVLRRHGAGRAFIAAYERLSPPLARAVANGATRRMLVRLLVVRPAGALARSLGGGGRAAPPRKPGSNARPFQGARGDG